MRTSTVRSAMSDEFFSPFFTSVYGMLGREALVVIANLSQLVVANMDEPIFHVQGCSNSRILIAILS